ncbi:hypothetical protein N8584_00160 [bacterium]|nr:hypothetical protein [bacterium]
MLSWLKNLFKGKIEVQSEDQLVDLCWEFALEDLDESFLKIRKVIGNIDSYTGDQVAKIFVNTQLLTLQVHSYIGIKHYYFTEWDQQSIESKLRTKLKDWIKSDVMPDSEAYQKALRHADEEETFDSLDKLIDAVDQLFASYAKECEAGEWDQVQKEISQILGYGILKVTCYPHDESFNAITAVEGEGRVFYEAISSVIWLEMFSAAKKFKRLKLRE